MREFTSFLAPLMKAFASFRTSSERWNEESEFKLLLFDKYCGKNYPNALELSQEMVDSWCKKRETELNDSCRSRISPMASFVHYLRKRGMTDVMPPEIPRAEPRTYIPHAFTETELKNFFAACDSIPTIPATKEQLSRRITIPVFFRLLYSSGIRTNEARMLRRDDVDFDHGVLSIRNSKGQDQHYLVLHDSMLPLMRRYDGAISKLHPDRVYFFPGKNGGFRRAIWVQRNFKEMWNRHNSSYAVPYELRHNYAVENINGWTDEGFEFNAKLLHLSKSMGHRSVESTKYYYSLVPRLADIIEARTDESAVIPEVDYESF